ncbi:hypothetical protein [Spartinivicinus poritis]|uniref:Uncharacterized protein n=1 Tax=Spartinivicinus poritis TaxID=2994640 RepID=A0ABT5U460_9GAMM|nr:hypothetical protein [Spartinivicinus sp. A2-2]MDE1461010.1 hypothetical protein [Spartinivicinus sp. A2-2]
MLESSGIRPISSLPSAMPSVDAMAYTVLLDQLKVYHGRLTEIYEKMQETNNSLSNLNNLSGEIRKLRSELKDDDATKSLTQDQINTLKEFGIEIPNNGKDLNKEKFNDLIANIDGKKDDLSQSNQLLNVRFQDYKKKYDSTFDLLSNILKGTASSKDNIIRNTNG